MVARASFLASAPLRLHQRLRQSVRLEGRHARGQERSLIAAVGSAAIRRGGRWIARMRWPLGATRRYARFLTRIRLSSSGSTRERSAEAIDAHALSRRAAGTQLADSTGTIRRRCC
jgi:hypothetical protein